MSVTAVVNVVVDAPGNTKAQATAFKARVEDVVKHASRAQRSFHGSAWTYRGDRPPFLVGGLFQFERSLSMQWREEAGRIARQIHDALRRETPGSIHVAVGALDYPTGVAQSDARRTSRRSSRRA